MTPLLRASFYGNEQMVQVLLKEYIDVNASDTVRSEEDLKRFGVNCPYFVERK